MKPDFFKMQLQTSLIIYYEGIKLVQGARGCPKTKIVKRKFEDQEDDGTTSDEVAGNEAAAAAAAASPPAKGAAEAAAHASGGASAPAVLWRNFSWDAREGLGISAWWGLAVDGDGAGFGHGKDH
jgi:hypothetical protein